MAFDRKAYAREYYRKQRAENRDEYNAYLRDWRSERRQIVNEQARSRYYKDAAKTLYDNARRRSTKKGLEFSISIEDIEIPALCPVFGIEFEYRGKKGMQSYAPSLDRIDSTKGYVKGNIRVMCTRANVLKNVMTKEECQMLVDNAFNG